jgi:hypothetical protein
MTPDRILGALIQGVLGGGRKRSRGALGFLTGRRGSLINASTVMTAAGLAWGAYEAATRKGAAASPPATPSPEPTPSPVASPGPAATPGPAASGPPPLPVMSGTLPPPPPLPPLPAAARLAALESSLPPDVLRAIRIAISAARADGELGAGERDLIVAKAREVGAEKLIDKELASKLPLAEIVKGVTELALREELYRIAFAIVRADEGVSGAERIYLGKLAQHLDLGPAATNRLEAEVARAIGAEG